MTCDFNIGRVGSVVIGAVGLLFGGVSTSSFIYTASTIQNIFYSTYPNNLYKMPIPFIFFAAVGGLVLSVKLYDLGFGLLRLAEESYKSPNGKLSLGFLKVTWIRNENNKGTDLKKSHTEFGLFKQNSYSIYDSLAPSQPSSPAHPEQ